MKFLLYYILRRFFVSLDFSDGKITFTKGVFLKRTAVLPFSAIVKTVVKQTPMLRIFRAKEITVFTLNGKTEFFLGKNEPLPFLPKMPDNCVRPRFREILFGALIDTRALAGIAFFSATLYRVGRIVGSEYFDRMISALISTAEKLSDTLMLIHVAVPQIASFAAVFAVCAWSFAFIVKLLRLSGFCLSRRGNTVLVKSGVVTLYETALVRNTAAVISRKTILCMLFGRSPVYYNKTVVYPAASEQLFERIVSRFFGIMPESNVSVKTPLCRIAAHCIVPLWIFGISSAALILFYLSWLHFAQLLKTALYCAVFASGYTALCGVILMKNARSCFGKFRVRLSYRRGTAVYCVCFPRGISSGYSLSQNLFQRGKSLCDYKALVAGQKGFRARQLPLNMPKKPLELK